MNMIEILKLKFPDADFVNDIQVKDHGDGVLVLAEWNNMTVARPIQKDLDKWAIELDLPYRQQQSVAKRQYPPIQEQLDMQYQDKLNNTTLWVDTITAIKTANPKPLE